MHACFPVLAKTGQPTHCFSSDVLARLNNWHSGHPGAPDDTAPLTISRSHLAMDALRASSVSGFICYSYVVEVKLFPAIRKVIPAHRALPPLPLAPSQAAAEEDEGVCRQDHGAADENEGGEGGHVITPPATKLTSQTCFTSGIISA